MVIAHAYTADELRSAWDQQTKDDVTIFVTRPILMRGESLPFVGTHEHTLNVIGTTPFSGITFAVAFDGSYEPQDAMPISARIAHIRGLRLGVFNGWGSLLRLNCSSICVDACRFFQVGNVNGPASFDAAKIVRPHVIGGCVSDSVVVNNCQFIACSQANWLTHCIYIWENNKVRTKSVVVTNNRFEWCGDTTAILGQHVIVSGNDVSNPVPHKCWSTLEYQEPPMLWSVFANAGAVVRNKASGHFTALTFSNRQDPIVYDYNDYSCARFDVMNCDKWDEAPAQQKIAEWEDWQQIGKDIHSDIPGQSAI